MREMLSPLRRIWPILRLSSGVPSFFSIVTSTASSMTRFMNSSNPWKPSVYNVTRAWTFGAYPELSLNAQAEVFV